MRNAINIIIENRMLNEKRDMIVYQKDTGRTYIISFNSCSNHTLKPHINGDYLYITIVYGPGLLKCNNLVDLPVWVNFEFNTEGKLTFTRSEEQTLLKISPGLQGWHLKLYRSSIDIKKAQHRIVISDEPVN